MTTTATMTEARGNAVEGGQVSSRSAELDGAACASCLSCECRKDLRVKVAVGYVRTARFQCFEPCEPYEAGTW